MNRILRFFWSLIPATVLLVIDLALRGDAVVELRGAAIGLYVLSLLFTWAFWFVARALTQRLVARGASLAYGVAAAIAATYGGLVVASYRFHSYFGVLPNLFTFEFIYEDTLQSASIVSSSTNASTVLGMACCAALGWVWLVKRLSSGGGRASDLGASLLSPAGVGSRGVVAFAVAVLVLCLPALHNNVRLYPGAFLPDAQVLFSFTKASEQALRGNTRTIKMLGRASRPPLEVNFGPLPFNVLFVINESLRAQNMSAWGYDRPTTPHLDAFFDKYSDRVVRVERAYANSTRTMFAFTGLLTGIIPAQPGAYLHTAPLVFDYAKAFSEAPTSLISAHLLDWGNVLKFVETSPIDLIWHKGTGDVPAHNALAIDDKYLAPKLAEWIDGMAPGQRFFSVFHTRGTHFPYDAPELFQRWGREENSVGRYDGAVAYLDHNFRAMIDVLEQRHLLQDTLIVSTADHAEALGEHGYNGHIHTFFDEEARIPMWFHLPAALVGTQAAEQLRSNARVTLANADLVPTLLDFLGIQDHPEVKLRTEAMLGSSLLRPVPQPRIVYMQNQNDTNDKYLFGGAGLVVGDRKYLLRVEGARVWEQVFDLSSDPRELHDLWPTIEQVERDRYHQALIALRNSRVVYERYLAAKK